MYFFVYTTIQQHGTIIAVTGITTPKERCSQTYKPTLRAGGDPYQYKSEAPNYFSLFIQPYLGFPRPAVQHPRLGRHCDQPDHGLSQSRDRFLGKCTDQHCAGCSLRRTFSLFLLQWEISAMLSDHHCCDLSHRFSGDVFYQRRISWRYAGFLRVCYYFYCADAEKKTGSDRFSAGDCPIYRTVSGFVPFPEHCNSFCHGS